MKTESKKFIIKRIIFIIISFCLLVATVCCNEHISYEIDDYVLSETVFIIGNIIGCIFALWCAIEFIILIYHLIKKLANIIRSSSKYKEKCYKRVNRIHTYYEKGSITKEEFEELKQQILSKINLKY